MSGVTGALTEPKVVLPESHTESSLQMTGARLRLHWDTPLNATLAPYQTRISMFSFNVLTTNNLISLKLINFKV